MKDTASQKPALMYPRVIHSHSDMLESLMTLLVRTRLVLNGWPGAPGYNILHFSPGTTAATSWSQTVCDDLAGELNGLLSNLRIHYAPGIQMTVDPEFAIIDHASGQIQDVVIADTGDTIHIANGAGADTPRGGCFNIKFMGDRYLNGRRLNGRMYAGPIAGDQFDTNGQIKAATIPYINDYFIAMTSGVGPRLAVYHRPQTSGVNDGAYADVSDVAVQDRPSYLRSRSL